MHDIDWNARWLARRRQRSCKGKGPRDWDRKAASFAKRNRSSSYVDNLITYIDPAAGQTILDVGAGPGTLAIPLARMVKRVTAVDYSPTMLEILRNEAAQQQITNISAVQAAWEDDWRLHNISRHDFAIASRSLSVDDLQSALEKLNSYATQKIFITDRVGPGPFDPDVFAAVGRKLDPGPDYIYTYNLLHQMGIYARVDFLDAEYCRTYHTRREAVDSCIWMLDDLTSAEQKKLDIFLDQRLRELADGRWEYVRRHTPRWAVISWDVNS